MIIRFGAKNYRSINELLVFELLINSEMKIGNFSNLVLEKEFIKTSRLNFIYGNNGSGKSNLIEGIKNLKQIVKSKEDIGLSIEPFKLSSNFNTEVFFTIEYIWNNIQYIYSILYDTSKRIIIDEELSYKNNKEDKILFSRGNKIFFEINNSEKERMNTFDLTRRSILNLFSTEIILSNLEAKKHIDNSFEFFDNIHFGFKDMNKGKVLSEIKKSNELINKISSVMRMYDLTITDIRIKEDSQSFDDFSKGYIGALNIGSNNDIIKLLREIYEDNKYKIDIYHGDNKLNFDEESTGTIKSINAISSVLMNPNGIWLIDDFESDLHTKNTIEFIKYITNNFYDSQFIFVTHELELLDLDIVKFKPSHFLMERDNKTYDSSITRLSEFSDLRTDNRHNWKKFYEENRLGKYPNPELLVK